MKKYALLAATAAFFVSPALAATGGSTTNHTETAPPGGNYVVMEHDAKGNVIGYTKTHVTYQEKRLPNGDIDYSGHYDLANGGTLVVEEGRTAYLAEADGDRFYAPTSGYLTKQGETFFVESGQVKRMEAPPTVAYVDSGEHFE